MGARMGTLTPYTMSIQFSDTVNNTGGVQQVRKLMRVDANQWPTVNIANSFNNWHDFVTGFAIGADKRFQWDDTNHTKLPEGTTDLTQDVTDYSFLTDEQGNTILTLTGVSVLVDGKYIPLTPVDRNDASYDISTFGTQTGVPSQYDKIADNIIRLDYKPSATVEDGLKFFFQRTGSYFTASDTTKSPGVSPLLHRGYVIAAAYDGALTLGLANTQLLAVERRAEEEKMVNYFKSRNNDDPKPRMTHAKILYI
jgi:hypothetical protein